MTQFVSETRHLDNLLYVRELLKLDLDNWVSTRKDGRNLDDVEAAMDTIDCIKVIEECAGGLHARMAALEGLKNEEY